MPPKHEKAMLNARLKWPKERHVLALEILDLLSQPCLHRERVVSDIVSKIRRGTGIDAVGVRLREHDDFPYFVTDGFPTHFVEAEHSLIHRDSSDSRTSDSSSVPRLRCSCGKVLQGSIDSLTSFRSEGGAVWTNDVSKILDVPSQSKGQWVAYSLCKAEGYKSVALIPIRSDGNIVGLLQLNARREGWFSPDIIRFFEGIATSIGFALERIASRAALARANQELERRAQDRTAELVKINDRLRMHIAERERIEEALQKSETRYRTLVETAREIIWTVDMNGHYTYVSPSVTRILGYTPDEFMVLKPLDSLTPASRNTLMHMFSEELKHAPPRSDDTAGPRTVEVEHRCKDGTTVWMEITATVLRGPGGETDGILGVSREISERKQIEEMKTEFMTTAAHELQTPLTSIIGYSELLLIREDFSAEEKADCLRRIHAQARNLATLVSTLLGIWNETGKTLPADASPWLMKETVEHIVDSFRKQTIIHRFETILPDQPITLMISKQSLTEILANVLNNAIQYSPEGGLIRVCCELIEDRCQFSVEDEGIGMTPEQTPKVFDRFYRADTSNTAVPGLGIGMSLVKSLIETEGGRVWVESAFGKGTTVRFFLPVGRGCELGRSAE